MFRLFRKRLRRRLNQLALRLLPVGDPWERLNVAPKPTYFGREAPDDWRAFLSSESSVAAASPPEVFAFLLSCRSTAAGASGATAPWPSVSEFEDLRAGDCTAHASWAWYKLVRLGVDAHLVIGHVLPFEDEQSRHAWVIFEQAGTTYLLEAVAKEEPGLIRPLSSVAERYRPEVGVDRNGRRYAFAGALLSAAGGVL